MSYNSRITTRNRSAICIMVDRSGSMSEKTNFEGSFISLSEAVANCINRLIYELISRCKGDEHPRHYFDVAVIGYSGDEIYPLLPTTDNNDWFISTTDLASCYKSTKKIQKQRILPDGRMVITNSVEKIWIEASAEFRTPMGAAMEKVHQLMKSWCLHNPTSFPPIVINITDGEATDMEPQKLLHLSQKLQGLRTTDGNLIMLNVHLCNSDQPKCIFPTCEHELPEDRNAKLLFEISSVMPDFFGPQINQLRELENESNFRGMAYNASVVDLIKMLNIGSSSMNMIL